MWAHVLMGQIHIALNYLKIYHIMIIYMYKLNLLLLASCLVLSAGAIDQADWVDVFDLPIGFMVKPFYAGYLDLTLSKSYYYVYYPSQGNPSKDPLVVRTSSGPGCSSLYSFLYSKGEFIFVPNTTNFRTNPNNWNKNANLLFIEGPAGVGFAQGEIDPMSDDIFAQENILALFKFYDKYPELKDQDLYLTGEQYSGITIPYMALKIIEHNNNPDAPSWTKIKLKGFMVENPCTLEDECDSHFQFSQYQVKYLHRHGFVSTKQFEEYESQCKLITPGCEAVRMKIEDDFIKTGSDIRNIYKQCPKQILPEFYKCMDLIGILAFFNHEHVQEDMHVKWKMQNNDTQWNMCNFDVMDSWKRDKIGSLHIYEQLLREEHDLRIWVLSGVLSANVPVVGTRQWIQQLKLRLGRPTTRQWGSWQYDDDINAGEVTQIPGLTFATIRSAGAHIYNDQPEIGTHVLESFLSGTPL